MHASIELASTKLEEQTKMEVSFLGAIGTVTGSCTWLRDTDKGLSFLVDCGVLHGESAQNHWSDKESWPFDPRKLNFVVLTHAHLDHCGLIPLLYKKGFRGPVWCTPETKDIATEVLKDAAYITKLFTHSDIDNIKWRFPSERFCLGAYVPVGQDLFLRFYRSGHILGAASVMVVWGPVKGPQGNILFSGDIGPGGEDREILPILRFPMGVRDYDYAVIESTYGAVAREDSEKSPAERLNRLRDSIEYICNSGGTLLLPAFAVGRAQDLLFEIHRVFAESPGKYDGVDVYLDGAMAGRVGAMLAEFYGRFDVINNEKVRPRWLGKQVFRSLDLDSSDPDDIDVAIDIVKRSFSVSEGECEGFTPYARGGDVVRAWRPLLKKYKGPPSESLSPRIVICGSSDGQFGKASQWIPFLLGSPDNMIGSTGYCAPETAMSRLLALSRLPYSERRKHPGSISWGKDRTFRIRDIQAKVVALTGYSGHADQPDLVSWVFDYHFQNPRSVHRTVFIQHGNDQSRTALKEAIVNEAQKLGDQMTVEIPSLEEGIRWYPLEVKS